MKAAKLLLNVYAFLLIEQDKRRPGGGGLQHILLFSINNLLLEPAFS